MSKIDPVQIIPTELIEVLKDGTKVYRGEIQFIDAKGKIKTMTRIVRIPKGKTFVDDFLNFFRKIKK